MLFFGDCTFNFIQVIAISSIHSAGGRGRTVLHVITTACFHENYQISYKLNYILNIDSSGLSLVTANIAITLDRTWVLKLPTHLMYLHSS